MGLPQGFRIRRASIADLETLVAHRRGMFHEMGYRDDAILDSMCARFRLWLPPRLQAAEYFAWLAVGPEGSIAAGAGLWLMDWPPHVIGAGKRRGNILNVYTEPGFRRRGLARQLMEAALECCRKSLVDTVILHASADGRQLYESMGFSATNEMRINL